MDYSELSDFEINSKVIHKIVNNGGMPSLEEIMQLPNSDEQTFVQWGNGCNWLQFDACNKWSDAGQLMEDNNIDLIFIENSDGEWSASKKHYESDNKNPKRAIAECFLMMKEVG
tara:strand:+ start:875 stop:1216 length:342 start_codon:yes stop_codon:yes gene_type:complete